jgi:hypothetical protein
MKAVTATENPYASPQPFEVPDSGDALLRATTRMYRGIGWAGVAYCLLVCPIAMVAQLWEPTPSLPEVLGGSTLCGLTLAFFMFVLRTANGLEVRFQRTYRRARWLGILAATMFFPLLTWPGILAVRRLERYRTFLNDEMQAES